MAGLSLKLVNKLARRGRYVKIRQRGKFDRENKLELEMRKSPRAFQLSRKPQRRLDRNWGPDFIAQKPVLAFEVLASSVDRHDYSGMGDFGIRIQLASGMEAAIGLQVGDIIRFRAGRAKGFELAVKALTDGTHVRLDDLLAYAIAGVAEQTQINLVADVAGSLNSKFFDINSALDANKYYVWFDNGTGVDPAPAGRTGVHIVYSNGASAATLAGLVATALNLLNSGNDFTAVGEPDGKLYVTNKATGATTDAADGSAPTGFSFLVLQQGVTANSSPSAESNIWLRAYLSSEKKSYV